MLGKFPYLLYTVAMFVSLSLPGANAQEVSTLSEAAQKKTTNLNPEYAVFSPELKNSKSKVPLIIYLHGAGGDGRNIQKVQRQASSISKAVDKFDKGPCLVIAPQCLKRPPAAKDSWIAADLNALLEDAKTKFPIDEARIYLTGNSMGGYGSWMWGGSNPEHFAAIIPVVGGIGPGGPKDVTPDLGRWAENLAKVPVWAFAGGQDRVVPAERSERIIKLIQEKGSATAKLTVYPDEGHGLGRIVHDSKELYDWIFNQSRTPE